MDTPEIRLTALAHGGGCGCKLAPSVLQQLLADQPAFAPFNDLIVGAETGDDAAVWQLDANTCVIATTDFFMPMVDDPFDFGKIAATNAVSDIYAMGGTPIMALAILGMPIDKLPVETIRRILAGGVEVCGQVGIPVAGGHSIDCPEPVYGLAVVGVCRPENVRRNATAKVGDALILTKPIGVGIYSAAIKKGALSADQYCEFMAMTTKLNAVGATLGTLAEVHAMTDVTGFGILGHALEMARGSGHAFLIDGPRVPLLSGAADLAQKGFITGASGRNWASYGASVSLPEDLPEWRRYLYTDPQTSGGLLIACEAGAAERVLHTIRDSGCAEAAVIGEVTGGPARVRVTGG